MFEVRGRVPSFGRKNRGRNASGGFCIKHEGGSCEEGLLPYSHEHGKNLFRKNAAPSGGNRKGSQKDGRQETFLHRKSRHSTSSKNMSGSEENDPLDLLSMLGFDRPSEGQDISFAELLSTSPIPTNLCPSASRHSRRADVTGSLASHEEESEDDDSDEPSAATITPVKTASKPIPAPVQSSSGLHIRLSYSPPSVISEDGSSFVDGRSCSSFLLSSSTGSSIGRPTSPSPSSGYKGKGIYYPYLLDDPQLIAEKQREHGSHMAYPSYIVSRSCCFFGLCNVY